MTIERQPARLAILSLRDELNKMTAEPEKPKNLGLLAPRKMLKDEDTGQQPEAKRVLNYMKMIRESMSNGV